MPGYTGPVNENKQRFVRFEFPIFDRDPETYSHQVVAQIIYAAAKGEHDTPWRSLSRKERADVYAQTQALLR